MLKNKLGLRKVLASLAFLLLLALLAGLADTMLAAKSDTMAAFYAEPEDTVDVMFVGGSHGAAAFDPTQIWEEQGFTSYNLFSWGQPPWTSYHYVKEALKTQSPRVVVVEGFAFFYGASYLSNENFNETSDDYSLLMRPSLNRMELAAAMSRCQTNQRPVYRYASLLRYHNRWQVFDSSFVTWFFEDHYGTAKGFGPNYTTEAFPPQTPPAALPEAEMYPYCEEYLYKLIKLSRDEGFELVIAAAPWVIEQDSEWALLQKLADICAAEGVHFVDYNNAAGAEAGIDMGADMAEHAHVNLYGAQKISAHIGAALAENYALPDHRGEADYAHWDAAAVAEGWEKDKMRLMLSPDAAQYLARLDDERLVAFIATRGAAWDDPDGVLAAGFEALGLPGDVLSGDAAAMVAVVDGGELALYEAGDAVSAAYNAEGVEVELSASAGAASLFADDRECARDYDGVAVLVLDKQSGEFVQSVVLRADEGWRPWTN